MGEHGCCTYGLPKAISIISDQSTVSSVPLFKQTNKKPLKCSVKSHESGFNDKVSDLCKW